MAALIVSTTRAAVARRPTGIVKLIRHAKSADAAHGCPALLNGEEAAICSSPSTTRILCAPSSIIAGQRIHWRLRQHHCQRNECRYLSREAHCSLLVVTRNNNVGSHFFPALAFGPIQESPIAIDNEKSISGVRNRPPPRSTRKAMSALGQKRTYAVQKGMPLYSQQRPQKRRSCLLCSRKRTCAAQKEYPLWAKSGRGFWPRRLSAEGNLH